jgi:hypothetical protein
MSKRFVALLFAGAVALHGAAAGKCGPGTVTASPNPVLRGAEVRITVPGAPPGVKTAQLQISGIGSSEVPLDGNTIAFPVPLDFPLGEYTGIVTIGKNTFGVCEAVKVIPFANWQPKLLPFDPEASYESENVYVAGRSDSIETTRLALRGSGFLQDRPADNRIFINSREIRVNWTGCASGPDLSSAQFAQQQGIKTVEIFGEVQSLERIELCRVPLPADRKLSVVLKQGNQATDAYAFSVYRWSKFPVAVAAAIIALSLGLTVLLLVYGLIKHQPKARRYNALKVLFLDLETDTYSLSRLQFYLWTAAALFGYTYLVIGRMFVQGQPWPEVPDNLPAIIGIGTATAVGSQVATTIVGPKGSGNENPSLGDLVTSGGVAAVDRIQMLVWTILGAGAFCVAALRYGPGTIKILDPVPTSMLYMMGLSSVGYLGGKLARKPGPVITELTVTPSEPDDAIANAAAPPPPPPPNLTHPIAEAEAIAQKLTVNTPAGSADTAVKALLEAVGVVGKANTTADAQAAVSKLVESRTKAELAAVAAADEFSRAGAASDTGRAAEIAQQAASALQDLAARVSSTVSMAIAPPAVGGSTLRFTRIIEVRGRNLSSQGLFEIGGGELPFRMLKPDADNHRQPEVVIREPDNPEMGRVIRLSIDPAQLEEPDFRQYRRWFGTRTDPQQGWTFAVMNPDGQKAEISFSVPPSSAQSTAMTGPSPATTPTQTPTGGNG